MYKENGATLFEADSCGPFVSVNIPQQQKPIYNSPDGTKLILSHKNGSAKVYDLPCSLNAGIDKSPALENNPFSVFPNPGSDQITVEYTLSNGINQAELVIYDMAGNEVRRYQVDNSFSNIIINQNDMASGTYFYSLMNNNQILGSKKVIAIK